MLGFFLVGYAVAQWVDKKWIHPPEEPDPLRPAGLRDFNLPRAVEGDPIPLFWGRVRVTSPNVIFAGGLKSSPIVDGGVTTGFEYRLTMLFSVGIPGQADGGTLVSSLRKFWIGDRLVWSGVIKTHTDRRLVNKPTLLGGRGQGGGVQGYIHYLPGNFTQELTSNVKIRIARSIAPDGIDQSLIPGYRGQSVVVLYGYEAGGISGTFFDSGWLVGESPNLDGYSFEVQSVCKISAIGNHGGIGDGDANPANVLYDVLTQSWGKAGFDPALIDTDSFDAAASTLEEEDNGFSIWWPQRTDVSELVELILAQIDGLLYFDPLVGKFVLKLIRDDYDPDLLPVLNPSNVLRVEDFASVTDAQVFNQVKVTYRSRARGYKDAIEVASDDSLIAAANGVIRSVEVNYPGCTTAELASALAARDLRTLSLPLAKVRVTVDRSAFRFPPGGRFVLSWPDFNNMEKVFVIGRVNRGTPGADGSEAIVLECLEDKFAFDYDYTPPASWTVIPLDTPSPATVRLVEEAPRWLQRRANAMGVLPNVDEQHLMYLAERPATTTTSYQGRVSIDDGATFSDDSPVSEFPATGRVAVAYTRELEPYDTATGLYVEMENEDVPATPINTTLLAGVGLGLIVVVPVDAAGAPIAGEAEVMGYETATLDSGTTYILGNVWRGLLDTVPRAHAQDEVVFFLQLGFSTTFGLRRFGAAWHDLDAELVTRLRSVGGFGSVDPEETIYQDATTVRLRHLLPYPPADLKVNAAKAAVEVTGEGQVDLTWKRRDRWATFIARGDAASEAVEGETTYAIRSTKDNDGSPATSAAVDLVVDLTDEDAYAELPLGHGGYGDLEVSVQARRPYTTADGSEVTLESWQEPAIVVTAPEWRQLLLNADFSDGLTHWTVNTGSPEVYDDGAGHVWISASGDSGDWEIEQVVDVRGFQPGRLTAVLNFLAKNFNADSDDTLTVTVESLDASLATLDSGDNGGPAYATAYATRDKAGITTLDDATAYIRVTILSEYQGTDNGNADSWIADLVLRIGQVSSASSNLIANPDFQTGTFTSWTNDDDSFVADTSAPLHTGSQYARPGDFATSAISQGITIPAGYEVGADAVMRFARANHNADGDKGQVHLEALGSGLAFITEETTANEAITPVDTWVMKELVLELPPPTLSLKVALQGTRVSGTPCDTAFDDMNLRIWKKLDPSEIWAYEYAEPVEQAVPLSPSSWALAFPDVPSPTLGWWRGYSIQGELGTEPDMEEIDDAHPTTTEAPFVGIWFGETMTRAALEFLDRSGGVRAETNATFANFDTSTSFSVRITFKGADLYGTGQDGVLIGRYAGTTDGATGGWLLYIQDDGSIAAKLAGASGDAYAADETRIFADRCVHTVWMVFDAGASELRLITQGSGEIIASTAAIGEFGVAGQKLVIGEGFYGQILEIEMWNSAIATADALTTMTHGRNPSTQGTQADSRTGVAGYTPIGYTAGFGARVSGFTPYQFPIGWSAELEEDGGTGFGLASAGPQDNRIPTTVNDPGHADWQVGGSATVSFQAEAGPEGLKDARSITGDNTIGQHLSLINISVDGSANQRVVFFAKAAAAGTARVQLINTSDVVKGTLNFAVTTEWTRISTLFTGWDDSTADCKLRFFASSSAADQTLMISGPFFLGATDDDPCLIANPYQPESGLALEITDDFEDASLLGNEGEILWEGAMQAAEPAPSGDIEILWLKNNATYDNSRLIMVSANAPHIDHFDGAGATASANASAVTDWNVLHTIRARWCRAGLLDASGAFAVILNGNAFDGDIAVARAAAWTPDSTAMDRLLIGGINALTRRVVVYTRESRLPLVTP